MQKCCAKRPSSFGQLRGRLHLGKSAATVGNLGKTKKKCILVPPYAIYMGVRRNYLESRDSYCTFRYRPWRKRNYQLWRLFSFCVQYWIAALYRACIRCCSSAPAHSRANQRPRQDVRRPELPNATPDTQDCPPSELPKAPSPNDIERAPACRTKGSKSVRAAHPASRARFAR